MTRSNSERFEFFVAYVLVNIGLVFKIRLELMTHHIQRMLKEEVKKIHPA